MTTINQKEYLKKYLGIGKAPGEKKKKRKKEKPVGNRLKIIDDDVDVLISREIEDDIAAANEDAPQIVAVIDERPIALQIDEKTHSSLWKPIGEPSGTLSDTQSLKVNSFKLSKQVKNSDNSTSTLKIEENSNKTVYRKKNPLQGKVKEGSYIDTNRREKDREKSNSYHGKYSGKDEYSPPRKNETRDEYSPRENHDDCSPPRRKNIDNDYSPSRKKLHDRSVSPVGNREADKSPPRRKYKEDDNSPPRRRKKDDRTPPRRTHKEKDYSPPRKRSKDDDSSLPRNKQGDNSPPRRNKRDDSSPLRRKNREEDNSPPRKIIKNEDSSPPRKKREYDSSPITKINKYENNSPPSRNYEEDNSPPRRRKNDDHTPPRRNKESSPSPKQDFAPPGKPKRKDGKKSRWSPEKSPEPSISQKMKKTLDGKQAGLQSAQELSKESKHLRQKEDEIFKNMSAEISGKNAATVIRGRKVKNLEEEAAKEKIDKDMKAKYDRWGKGLRQVEDQSKKIEEQLHEMSKPLARYADDEDLEKYLKEQEREGDPMLAYIRKKKKKEKVAAGIPDKPMYNGEFMPNRFGIRPGYRWDGVDRSNGYEKKWFQVQNAKKADREEAFKWSTEDM